MKKGAIILVGCVFFAGVVYITLASAQTWKQKVTRADRNKDGVVDRKEARVEQALEQKKRSNVNTWWEERADTNNDGHVDSKELSSWKTLEKSSLDLNGDGTIDSLERRRCWVVSRSKVNTALERGYDTNSDGWLDASEVRALLNDRYAVISSGGNAKVDTAVEKMYDVDSNGVISVSEASAMKGDAGF